MSNAALSQIDLQKIVDDAVAQGVAPGIQAVIFDKTGTVSSVAAGDATIATETDAAVPMTTSTVAWMASCSKLSIAILALQLLERKDLWKNPSEALTLDDIDNHEKLTKILPEFALDNDDSLCTFVWNEPAFHDGTDEHGRRKLNVRKAKRGITLRHLFTHSSGLSYIFNEENTCALENPGESFKPHNGPSFTSGVINDHNVVLVNDPGATIVYGPNTDFLGQFAVRASGKNLRQLLRERIFDPLGINKDDIDIFVEPQMGARMATSTVRLPDGKFMSIPPFQLPMYEGDPPAGEGPLASAPILATTEAYSHVLRGVLSHNPAILSEATWQLVSKEATEPETKAPVPMFPKAVIPQFTNAFDTLYPHKEVAGTDKTYGFNLLQQYVPLTDLTTGRPAKTTFGWAGLANSYYTIDPENNFGFYVTCQLLPFADPGVCKLRDQIEAEIYSKLAK
ncbi:beta-lactamase/transpeptidase-like protein [Testicularia cyperi]|uniref:Beta-lactamase/transpeptidase-like protein n=1 Tax=Testicularia cyperi TaxID=1882483 RepID=A0A317XHU5_9BASI|nr:beta-lactamase/transpeptidase-like protein [Testicularia cyperi]